MFLKSNKSDDLLEVLDVSELFDPFKSTVLARSHCGEEMQDPADYIKSELVFPSGEPLPRCWQDSHYASATHQAK